MAFISIFSSIVKGFLDPVKKLYTNFLLLESVLLVIPRALQKESLQSVTKMKIELMFNFTFITVSKFKVKTFSHLSLSDLCCRQ